MTVAGVGRPPGRKNTRRLQDLVRALEFGVLPAQPTEFLGLSGGGPVATLCGVGFILADPVAERFGMDTELLGEAADDRSRVGLPVKLDRAAA
jgi:hypothetical protein